MNCTATRTLTALLLAAACGACGDGATDPEPTPVSVDGIWRAAEAGVSESTLELAVDGAAHWVEADLAGRTCTSSAGTWSTDGDRLVVRLTPPGGTAPTDVRSFDFDVRNGRLVLTSGTGATTYAPASSVQSCVTYGFGTWQGTLSAQIDGVQRSFTNLAVDTERIRAGSLEILACFDTAPPCTAADVVLLLQLNAASGGLTPGTYPLGDQSTGFYGLVNLFPDDPDFPGFDSLRLTPTGVFVLTSIADDRVVATFEFRANQRASNAPPAPDGSTFAQVSGGIVDLTYR